MAGVNYQRQGIENIKITCNYSGRYGVVILSGDRPYIRNVQVVSPRKAGVALVANNFNWIENPVLKNIVVNASGYDAYYLQASGPNASFINEGIFEGLECRGVSLKENGGIAIRAVCSGTVFSKISEISLRDLTLDAQRASAIANGFDIGQNPILLTYTAGAANKYESWDVSTGGVETTTGGSDFRSDGIICAEPGVSAEGWSINLGVSAGWSRGGIKGAFLGRTLKIQSGQWSTSYPNSWTQAALATSTTVNFDVGFPVVLLPVGTRQKQGAWYELALFAQRFSSTDKKVYKQDIFIECYTNATDQYWTFLPAATSSLVGGDIFTLNSVTVISVGGGTVLTSSTPPAGVRCSVTTSATWGTGGGENRLYGIMTYKGASHEQFPG